MNKQVWLKCSISEGLFPGEFAVTSKNADNETFSLFASERDLKFETPLTKGETRGLLAVKVLDQTIEQSLIVLPSPSLEKHSVVKVPNKELQT